nr:flagellar hook-basal body complex protein FliE [Gammaproteobacteria bacterium]
MDYGMSASIAAVEARIEQDVRALSSPSIKPSLDIEPAHGHRDSQGLAAGFRQILYAVNAQDQAAADKMAAVDSGQSDDLVGAMLASQQASLSFSMLLQVRNKVVAALDDLMKLHL